MDEPPGLDYAATCRDPGGVPAGGGRCASGVPEGLRAAAVGCGACGGWRGSRGGVGVCGGWHEPHGPDLDGGAPDWPCGAVVPLTAPQLHLRDDATLRGKPRRVDHPWGMPDRVWWLVQRYVGQGVPESEAIRLAYLFRERERLQALLEDPSSAWSGSPRRAYERLEEVEPAGLPRLSVVIRAGCSRETRRLVEGGRMPGVRWVDGVGGVRAG